MIAPPANDSSGAIDWANPVAVTDTATLTIGKHHVVTVTSADKTLTLPAVSGNAGKLISIEIAADTTKLITIDGNSSETIDGATTRIMWAKETATLLCNGTSWTKIAGKTIPMVCTLYLNDTAQLFNADTNTKISLNAAMSGGCSLMANTGNSRIDIVRPGLYNVKTCVTFNNNNATAGVSRALGAINGTVAANGLWIASYRVASYQSTPFNEMPMSLSAGDYVELYGAFSGGSFSTSSIYKNAYPFTHLTVKENPNW